MGVKGLLDILEHSFKNFKIPLENYHMYQKYDNAFVEMNYFLHKYVKTTGIDDNIFQEIKYLQNIINPSESFNFVFDGSPPLLKLAKMRKSREKLKNRHPHKCKITVGTEFMNDFEQDLKNNFQFKYKILSHNEDGEGEMKIAREIKQNNLERNIVITPDNDVILLMIALGKMDLIVCNREKDFNELIQWKNIEKNLQIIDENDTVQIRDDLLFLLLLLGNDYNYKLPNFNFELSWRNYISKKTNDKRRFLIKNLNNKWYIDIPFLFECMEANIDSNNFKIIKMEEREICIEYLKTVLWNFEMYKQGKCLDYSYIPSVTMDSFKTSGIFHQFNYNPDLFIDLIQPPRSNKRPLQANIIHKIVIPDDNQTFKYPDSLLKCSDELYSLEKVLIE